MQWCRTSPVLVRSLKQGKAMAKIKYQMDGIHNGAYVRAWREKRQWAVQVWTSGKPEGDPDGDWVMPGVFSLMAAVEQSILQSKK